MRVIHSSKSRRGKFSASNMLSLSCGGLPRRQSSQRKPQPSSSISAACGMRSMHTWAYMKSKRRLYAPEVNCTVSRRGIAPYARCVQGRRISHSHDATLSRTFYVTDRNTIPQRPRQTSMDRCRQAALQPGRCGLQARRPWPHLPQVRLRRLPRGAAHWRAGGVRSRGREARRPRAVD